MKVVCDSCHAKYQVPDERVAGRKLKIRCRRCAATIIVRGDRLTPVADGVQPEAGAQANVGVASGSPASAPPVTDDSLSLASHPPTAELQAASSPAQGHPAAAPEVDMPVDSETVAEAAGPGLAPSAVGGFQGAYTHEGQEAHGAADGLGGTAAVPGPATEAVAEWFASLDDAEHGPMDLQNLVGWLAGQPAAWDAYLWRDGFPDWIEARDVDLVVQAATAAGFAPPPQGAAQAPIDEEVVPTQMVHTHSVAGQGASSDVDQATSVAVHPDPSVNLAETVAPPPLAVEPVAAQPVTAQPVTAQAAPSSPRVSGAAAFSGSRNEESVLFNLADLQKVASVSAGSLPPIAVPAQQPTGGYASGDGSGLIDIRALAALSQAAKAAEAAEAASTQDVAPDAHGAVAAANPAATLPPLDTLAPIANAPPREPNKAMPYAIVAAAAILAAAVVVVGFVLRSPDPVTGGAATAAARAPLAQPPAPAVPVSPGVPATGDQVAGAVEPSADPTGSTPAAQLDPSAPAKDSAPSVADGPADDTEGTAVADTPAKPSKATSPAARRKSRRATAAARKATRVSKGRAQKSDSDTAQATSAAGKSDSAAAAKPVTLDDVFADSSSDTPGKQGASKDSPDTVGPSKTASEDSQGPSVDDLLAGKAAPPQPAKSRSIDDLLNVAVTEAPKKKAKASTPPAASANLAAQPSRTDVLAAMRGVTPGVQRCASKHVVTGIAKVKMTVSGKSGKVTAAGVTGVSGPVIGCIEGVVRKAYFPKFTKSAFSVAFPFRL